MEIQKQEGEQQSTEVTYVLKQGLGPLHCCCFEGCTKDAEFLIIDTNEKRYDIAETHACEDHLGSLIGSVEPTEPKGPWSVYLLA